MVGAAAPRLAGLLLGTVADALLGDPRRGHPVAGFGAVAATLERGWYADSRRRGAAHVAACLLPPLVAGASLERRTRHRPLARALVTAAATWAVVGGHSLARQGVLLHDRLAEGDVPAARAALPHLCGRDPEHLDAVELARATVESLAENTSDAVVAPLLWGAVAGVPGLLGYRAVNTLDAMVGHRSPRYSRFGWAAARLDDAANLLPARLTAASLALAAPLVGGRPADAMRAWWRDAGRHPSPNAGPVEAAAAGALGVRLGGANRYGDVVEDRGPLGAGPPPGPQDVSRALRLCRAAAAVSLAACCAVALLAVPRGGRR
jgi:adenosylcobinamide-phosphate synthase